MRRYAVDHVDGFTRHFKARNDEEAQDKAKQAINDWGVSPLTRYTIWDVEADIAIGTYLVPDKG